MGCWREAGNIGKTKKRAGEDGRLSGRSAVRDAGLAPAAGARFIIAAEPGVHMVPMPIAKHAGLQLKMVPSGIVQLSKRRSPARCQ